MTLPKKFRSQYIYDLINLASIVTGKFRLAAAVYDERLHTVAYGVNSYNKTHPIQARYAAYRMPMKIFLHAEMDALIKSRYVERRYGMIVVRIDSRQNLRLAKPCDICMTAIEASGLSEIYYSNDDGEFDHIRIR